MTCEQVENLVRKAQLGDQQAFSELVKISQQKVFRYCYPMLTNRQDAEDIVQETFIKAFQHLHNYKDEGNFIGWVMTIAHRLCLNKLKSNKRMFVLLHKMTIDQPTVTTHTQYEEQVNDVIFKLLNHLKPKYRAIVILKVIQGFSYEEMSGILEESPVNLRKQYERAKKSLQQKDYRLDIDKESEVYYERSPKLRTTSK
ncbi:MAG TPA: RNA polymerase sigma factor [Candidatus Paenibacillus intestinavium]|nr:RNA polymerase sigma factor [Candidatus Paenibacillus intestinavium]